MAGGELPNRIAFCVEDPKKGPRRGGPPPPPQHAKNRFVTDTKGGAPRDTLKQEGCKRKLPQAPDEQLSNFREVFTKSLSWAAQFLQLSCALGRALPRQARQRAGTSLLRTSTKQCG